MKTKRWFLHFLQEFHRRSKRREISVSLAGGKGERSWRFKGGWIRLKAKQWTMRKGWGIPRQVRDKGENSKLIWELERGQGYLGFLGLPSSSWPHSQIFPPLMRLWILLAVIPEPWEQPVVNSPQNKTSGWDHFWISWILEILLPNGLLEMPSWS